MTLPSSSSAESKDHCNDGTGDSQKDGDFATPWCVAVEQDPAWERCPALSLIRTPGSTENSLIADSLRTARGVRGMRKYIRRTGTGRQHQHQHQYKPSNANGSGEGRNNGNEVKAQSDSILDGLEVLLLVSVGDGLNGLADTCHGGIVATLLDEVMGEIAVACEDEAMAAAAADAKDSPSSNSTEMLRQGTVTADLRVAFKRRIATPTVLACRAWLAEPLRPPPSRRIVVEAAIQDRIEMEADRAGGAHGAGATRAAGAGAGPPATTGPPPVVYATGSSVFVRLRPDAKL